MKKICILFFLICFSSILFAQQMIRPPVRPVIRLNVNDADKDSIKLTELKIDVKLTSDIAVTTYDMIFTNSSNRILEGEFEFPLAEGQTVFDFALDIDGKLRKGVVVEKEKGRQVFEDIVRRNVDPGLLEMTQGNNFKARVYPLPAKGSRHVQISYQQLLKNEDAFVLEPLYNKKLDKFSFNFTDYSTKKNDNADNNEFNFSTGSVISSEKKDFIWNTPVSIKLEKNLGNAKDKSVFIENLGTDTYFYYNFPLEEKEKAKSKVKNLAIYVDTSLSMANRNLEKELEFLKKYITEKVSGWVQIVTFSNDINETVRFKNSEWQEMEAFIRNLNYDGGTNLSELKFPSSNADEILLVTDGLVNLGAKSDIKFPVKTMVISSSVKADYGQMNKIARENGGVYINLQQKNLDDAIKMAVTEPFRLIEAEYDSKVFTEVYPVALSIVEGNFTVSGILKRKSGYIKLKFGYGNKITRTETISVSAVKGIEAENIARFWAQMKLNELKMNSMDNKSQILDLAKKFTIVTEGTSLIVLENLWDYQRYGIVPPADLIDEYNKIVGNRGNKQAVAEGIPSEVYKWFEEYKKWWNMKPEDFEVPKKELNIERAGDDLRRSNAVVLDSGNLARASQRASESLEMNDMMMEAETFNTPAPMVALKSTDGLSQSSGGKISIQSWNPDLDYLKVLKVTETKDMYEKYLGLRKEYENSPSFYMDTASYFFEEGLTKEALRIVSNLAELNLENSDVLRALGNKLVDFGEFKQAAVLFEKLTKQFPEIPQFFRDYALCCEKNGEYQKAADALYYVASRSWNSRFNQVQMIALNDLNGLISRFKINTTAYDPKLIADLPVDIRIVLTWNTDNCDIDLWVTDPSQEKCYYAHNRTAAGGRISRDFTQGYGPEEFCLKKAPDGKYKIQAHYYGTSSQKILQPVVVNAEVYTNFGTKNQKCEILTLQLETVKGDFTIGEIEF